MDNQIYTVTNRMIQINRQHKQRIDSRIAELGIHRTQHRILMHLARAGDLPSQKTLADIFEVTPAAISGSLQKLEADGYILRRLGEDSRYNQITITDRGREVVERTRALFTAVDNSLFEGFSEEEIGALSDYLARIIENLKGE